MGYQIYYDGHFTLDRALTDIHRDYLTAFSQTRRMKRDARKAGKLSDPLRVAAGLPVGEQGEYFVGGKGFHGQDDDESVTNHNTAPAGQPSLWCDWEPADDGPGDRIWHNGSEKSHNDIAWLEYLVEHFFKRWGYTLSGEVQWQGEEPDDRGVIYAKDNVIEAVKDVTTNPGPSWA
jgi:hypothetical protein